MCRQGDDKCIMAKRLRFFNKENRLLSCLCVKCVVFGYWNYCLKRNWPIYDSNSKLILKVNNCERGWIFNLTVLLLSRFQSSPCNWIGILKISSRRIQVVCVVQQHKSQTDYDRTYTCVLSCGQKMIGTRTKVMCITVRHTRDVRYGINAHLRPCDAIIWRLVPQPQVYLEEIYRFELNR